MEPAPISTATAAFADLCPAPSNSKLRLLCSYGGHIIPRPHDKSLFYSGGETRIVGVDRRTTAATLSALTAHLSNIYHDNLSFVLKYLLPDGDLDALISVTNDEDLHIMIEEQDLLAGSPNHSRIRLFLFPAEAESDPKAEAWFRDALRSLKITQRGQSAESGMNNGSMDLLDVSSLCSIGEARHFSDLASVPESMVLETSSSIGSNGSSVSTPNLGLNGIHAEDGGVNSADNKIKSPSPGSMESDSSIASIISHVQTPTYHDPAPQVQSVATLASPNTVASVGHDAPENWVQMPKEVSSPASPSPQPYQTRCQQEVRYIQAGASVVPQYPAGSFPAPPFNHIYYSPTHLQQQQPNMSIHPNGAYPIYLSPIRPTAQVYNVPMQCNIVDTTSAPSWPPMHPHATILSPSIAYKEVAPAIIPSELPTKVYMPVAGAMPVVHIPSCQNQQSTVNLSEV